MLAMATPLLDTKNKVLFFLPKDIKLMTDSELRRFASDLNVEVRENAKDLWRDANTGRSELIDAGGERAAKTPGRVFEYDSESLSYYQETRTGRRRVDQRSIKRNVDRFALYMKGLQVANMISLMSKQITPQQYYDETVKLMRESYLASVYVARGSSEPLDEEEKNYWVLILILLLLLFHDFVLAISAGGRIPVNGKLRTYAGLRGLASRSVYENFRLHNAQKEGFKEGRRLLSIAEHCEETETRPGCVEEAARGWTPIEQIVMIGGCQCYDNCRCTIEYRRK
jgi:hypothetical protein